MVPSRSRKTAGRSAAGLGKVHLRGTEPRLRGSCNVGRRNSCHTAMIGGASTQETRAAVRLFLNDGTARRDWGRAVRIGGAENRDNWQADGRSNVHCAGIITDKEMALRQESGKSCDCGVPGE